MKKRKINTSIFLMEMIMVCGFLMISISLCVQGFAKARDISKLAEDKGNAVLVAQSLAEEFESDDSFKDIQTMDIRIAYDKDWNETRDEESEEYICRLHISDLGESRACKELNIGIYKEDKLLYDLTVSRFCGEDEGEQS